MRTIALILIAFAVSAATMAQTTLYRWVDDQGRVHYSDRPQPDAKPVEIAEPMTMTTRRPVVEPSTREAAAETDRQPGQRLASYNSVGVIEPTQDQVLWNIGGTLTVNLSIQPPLLPGHSLQVSYDGAPVADWPAGSTRHEISNVYRGTHTLVVTVVDAGGDEIAVSKPVSFHVKQSSILN